MISPTQYPTRSPLYHLQANAQLSRLGNSLTVARYSSGETEAARRCALVDLCNLARVGFRGADSAHYLQAQGFELPPAPNLALRQTDGSLVARLSRTEYLLLSSLGDQGQRLQRLENGWQQDATANYLLPRTDSHAWLRLCGQHCAEVMAKLCAVDLRPQSFPPLAVAQTSAARINVIVINAGTPLQPCLELLCDRAAAEYFWGALLDAMGEFDGCPVGIEALI